MFRSLLLLAAVLLLTAAPTGAAPAITKMSAEERFDLLHPGTPQAQREALFRRAVELSAAGSGFESFLIGVVFRHGQRHPSKLAPQRIDLARQYLRRCLDQAGCPGMALASLSELEFEAGDVHWARVWALAYGWVAHEVDAQLGRNSNESYATELLIVSSESLPKEERAAHLASLLTSIREDLGPQLERMVEREVHVEPPGPDTPRLSKPAKRYTRIAHNYSGQRLYLLRLRPEGGPAASIALLEALPDPANVEALDEHVRTLHFAPLPPQEANTIVLIPLTLANNRRLPKWVR